MTWTAKPRPQLMTRQEFETFMGHAKVYVQPPYDVMPCGCGDVNCHGWRFVERGTR